MIEIVHRRPNWVVPTQNDSEKTKSRDCYPGRHKSRNTDQAGYCRQGWKELSLDSASPRDTVTGETRHTRSLPLIPCHQSCKSRHIHSECRNRKTPQCKATTCRY